jgi:hypothetical protein
MKRHILMFLGVAYFGLPFLAAAAPNFSGSWLKDNSKSDPVPNPLMLREDAQGGGGGGRGQGRGGGGGGRGPGGRGGGPMPMVVTQDANSLQVTEPQGALRKYTVDGKPHIATMDTGVQKAHVTASWQGDTLVISSEEPYGGMPGNVTLHAQEVWSLSPDGNTLTIATTRTIPAVEKSYKEVYNKK